MPVERFETVIIGGGQAGLTMSHCLAKHGRPHVVLERHRIAERWRSERWDSLRFQFPNWAMRLPEFAYTGNSPDDFAHRDEVVRFIEAYASFIQAPVRTGVKVRALRLDPETSRFRLDLGMNEIEAENVVIATGPYQRPAIPAAASDLRDVLQLSASQYRNPAQLPPGGILVAGAGASGCQIAEELLRAGRSVYLSVGPHRRVPRTYRGKDIIWWIGALGLDEKIVDPDTARQPPLLLSGAYGGRSIDLRAYAADGMTLLGRLMTARDGIITFAPALSATLAAGDESYTAFTRAADAFTANAFAPHAFAPHAFAPQSNMPATSNANPPPHRPEPLTAIHPITTLDPRAAGITSVIWATGYRYDFDWIHLDIFDRDNVPRHHRGIARLPGVYFLGLQYLHKTKSSFLSGVGEDAAYLAEHIALKTSAANDGGEKVAPSHRKM